MITLSPRTNVHTPFCLIQSLYEVFSLHNPWDFKAVASLCLGIMPPLCARHSHLFVPGPFAYIKEVVLWQNTHIKQISILAYDSKVTLVSKA